MIFLKPEDFKKQIKADQLSQITDSDQSLLDDAELAALEEMQSYLRSSFDVAAIFKPIESRAPQETRNAFVVMQMVDIMLYHLHSSIVPRNIPAVRITRYDNAIKWLDKVQSGKLAPDLPARVNDSDGDGTPDSSEQESSFYIVSQKRNNWYY